MLTLSGEVAALVLALLLGISIGWAVWGRGASSPRDGHRPRHAAPRRLGGRTTDDTDLSTGDVWLLPRSGRRERAHAMDRRTEQGERAFPELFVPTEAAGVAPSEGTHASATSGPDSATPKTAEEALATAGTTDPAGTDADAAESAAGSEPATERVPAAGDAVGEPAESTVGTPATPDAAPADDVADADARSADAGESTAAGGPADVGGDRVGVAGPVGASESVGEPVVGAEAAASAVAGGPADVGGDRVGVAGPVGAAESVGEPVVGAEAAASTVGAGSAPPAGEAAGVEAAESNGPAVVAESAQPAVAASSRPPAGDPPTDAAEADAAEVDAPGSVARSVGPEPRVSVESTESTVAGVPDPAGPSVGVATESTAISAVRGGESPALVPASTADGTGAGAARPAPAASGNGSAPGRAADQLAEHEDDLRQVVGIGPVIQQVLASIGITTYRQLARLADDGEALARAATALGGDVRSRIERQRWVEQARELHFQKYGERL